MTVGELKFGSFEDFFSANFAAVVRALTLAIGDAAEAEELAQEAFMRACLGWRRVSSYDRPATWVYVVALNHRRRSSRRRPIATGERPDTDPLDVVDEKLTVRDALAGLGDRQRLALVLRFVADLPLADIAEAMGCAEGTVKSTLHAALAAMRAELNEEVVA